MRPRARDRAEAPALAVVPVQCRGIGHDDMQRPDSVAFGAASASFSASSSVTAPRFSMVPPSLTSIFWLLRPSAVTSIGLSGKTGGKFASAAAYQRNSWLVQRHQPVCVALTLPCIAPAQQRQVGQHQPVAGSGPVALACAALRAAGQRVGGRAASRLGGVEIARKPGVEDRGKGVGCRWRRCRS